MSLGRKSEALKFYDLSVGFDGAQSGICVMMTLAPSLENRVDRGLYPHFVCNAAFPSGHVLPT